VSSKDREWATPPVSTILICGRTANSYAMLRELVTIVSLGFGPDSANSGLVARVRAISVVVVPPLSPTMFPGVTISAAASATACFCTAWCPCL
jgi:hypothetical protein